MKIYTPSGRGRAHAIVNAAGHAWDHQATVRHQDFQASCMYHDYRGPCLVHPEAGTHTWGNCFQNPHTRGGRADCTAGRHNLILPEFNRFVCILQQKCHEKLWNRFMVI